MAQIHKAIPKELLKDLTHKERDTSQVDQIKSAISSGKVSKDQAQRLENLMASGAFQTVKQAPKAGVENKINAYLDGKIRAEIAAGRLKKPQQDEWMKRMKKDHYGKGR